MQQNLNIDIIIIQIKYDVNLNYSPDVLSY